MRATQPVLGQARPVYQLSRVAKRYGERVVCCVEELEVETGGVLGIMGPSGAGKSTLLRLLGFLEPPTAGSICFHGASYEAGSRPPLDLRRKVTLVFQDPLLFNTTVWDNVAYGLRVRGARDVEGRVHRALDEVGLLPLARVRASTLSSGEARRAALARAFVIEPEVLLLDEPTANLDPANVALIEQALLRMNADRGTTTVLVTHNVFQARRLASRVALMLDGRVVEEGPAGRIFSSPRDPRTATFIAGEMVY